VSFTTFRTWVPLEVVTAAMLNEQIRDNGNVLKTYIDDDGSHRTLLQGFAFSAGQGNAGGGGDTQLTSYDVTIPASYLSQPGDTLIVEGTFAQSATSEAKTIKLKVGGGTLRTIFTATTGGTTVVITFRVVVTRRTSTTGVMAGFVGYAAHNGAPTWQLVNATTGTVAWANSQTLAIFASGATAASLFLTDYYVRSGRGLNGVTV